MIERAWPVESTPLGRGCVAGRAAGAGAVVAVAQPVYGRGQRVTFSTVRVGNDWAEDVPGPAGSRPVPGQTGLRRHVCPDQLLPATTRVVSRRSRVAVSAGGWFQGRARGNRGRVGDEHLGHDQTTMRPARAGRKPSVIASRSLPVSHRCRHSMPVSSRCADFLSLPCRPRIRPADSRVAHTAHGCPLS